jgi:non-heme chloroperoxidase
MRKLALLLLLYLFLCDQSIGQTTKPTKVRVGGVELHYIEQGNGDVVILLHGGQGDYRAWESQIQVLSAQYRVISYSRRYSYPNNNLRMATNHSPYTEADDLVKFIKTLRLGRAHLVGTSMGAFTALLVAIKHPEMVRSLVLVEPPIHRWIEESPSEHRVYTEFMTSVWEPTKRAFKTGNDREALKSFNDGLSASPVFERLSPERLVAIMDNARALKALVLSSNPFPKLDKEKVRQLRVPVMIVGGENTVTIHKLVNQELARLLPGAEHVVVPNAGHSPSRENPQSFNESLLRFLSRAGKAVKND